MRVSTAPFVGLIVLLTYCGGAGHASAQWSPSATAAEGIPYAEIALDQAGLPEIYAGLRFARLEPGSVIRGVDSGAGAFRFTRSPELSGRIERAIAEAIVSTHPDARSEVARALQDGAVIAYFDGFLEGYGYSGTDLADVATAHHLMAWEIANGEEFPLDLAPALNEQLRTGLAAREEVAALSGAGKQALAEAMVYEVVIASQAHNELRRQGESVALTALRDQVHRAFADGGLDLRGLRPAVDGFAPTEVLVDDAAAGSASTAATDTRLDLARQPQPTHTNFTPAASFDAVYMVTNYSYGVGGAVSIVYRPYVVFGDGRAYRGLDAPPDAIDPANRTEPGSWVRWRHEEDEYVITNADGSTDTYSAGVVYRTFPADPGETLQGTWHALTGGGNTALGGSTLVHAASAIEFSTDGRFGLRESGGGSSGDAGVRVTAVGRRAFAGSYRLDGHAIELTFDDGRVERHGFYFFPNHGLKDTKAFGLGEATYSRGSG